jgi:hypothetical protein
MFHASTYKARCVPTTVTYSSARRNKGWGGVCPNWRPPREEFFCVDIASLQVFAKQTSLKKKACGKFIFERPKQGLERSFCFSVAKQQLVENTCFSQTQVRKTRELATTIGCLFVERVMGTETCYASCSKTIVSTSK